MFSCPALCFLHSDFILFFSLGGGGGVFCFLLSCLCEVFNVDTILSLNFILGVVVSGLISDEIKHTCQKTCAQKKTKVCLVSPDDVLHF